MTVLSPFILNPAEGQFSVFAWVKGGAPGHVVVSQQASLYLAEFIKDDANQENCISGPKNGIYLNSIWAKSRRVETFWRHTLSWEGDFGAQLMGWWSQFE